MEYLRSKPQDVAPYRQHGRQMPIAAEATRLD